MLPKELIEEAVEIQNASYKLFLWLAQAIDAGVISFSHLHGDATPADNTYEWFDAHYNLLPAELRPSRDGLKTFSNYFGSYVTTSFDLVAEPGLKLQNPAGSWKSSCFCELCSRLVSAPHLRPKKLTKRDKEEARHKRVSRVLELGRETGLLVPEHVAIDLATGPMLRSAAYSAYGQSLLERIDGVLCDPYVLALWREIAWKPEGSPFKGLQLRAQDILHAERALVSELERICESMH